MHPWGLTQFKKKQNKKNQPQTYIILSVNHGSSANQKLNKTITNVCHHKF